MNHLLFARRVAPLFVSAMSAMGLMSCSDTADVTAASNDDVAESRTLAAKWGSDVKADLDLVREIEDRRLLGDARLKNFLRSAHAPVAEAAAIAVGRIGDPSLTQDVVASLGARDARVRAGAALALGLLGGSGVEEALLARLGAERHRSARSAILLALGRKGTAASLSAVNANLAEEEPTEVQTAAAEALGTMVRNGVVFGTNDAGVARLLSYSGSHPAARATTAAFAISGLSGQGVALPEAATVAAFFDSPSPSARVFLSRALSVIKTTAAIEAMVHGIASDRDAHARADFCRFLARTGASPAVLKALSSALRDRSPEVVASAASSIATLGAGASALIPTLTATYDAARSDWVRQTLLTTLVTIGKEAARSRVEAGLSGAWPVQLAAIPALAVLGTEADVAKLMTFATQSNVRLAAAAIEAIATLDPSKSTPSMKEPLRAVLQTKDFQLVTAVANVVVAFGWSDFAADLRALYDAFPGPGNLDGRKAILYALGTVGDSSDVPLFERGLLDDEWLVSQTAADSYKAVTGVDVSHRVRLVSVVRAKTPSPREVERALDSLVLLDTTRGPIVVRMLPEAPRSATNFVGLASRGFYDGLPFHRVVPNFVAQGGDPRGDGFGGSDQLVREEISRVPHRRGTVGMATQGKDTASSQFFINHGWNVGLDGRYTVFGEIVWGIEAADRLEIGDVVKRAKVLGHGGLAALQNDSLAVK